MLAVSRRYEGRSASVIRLPGLVIDKAARVIDLDGTSISLSSREWAVLEKLVERPGAVISKPQLNETLYAFGAEIESNTVEVYISRLRKKIGHDRIETIRGIGYSIR
jgi:DNA-binding response OmpR family regulator